MTSKQRQRQTRIGFRCDGDTRIGLGHIVGCLRLAKLIAQSLGFEAELQLRASPVAENLVRDAGFPVSTVPASIAPDDDIEQLLAAARQRGWAGIVINFCKADLERYEHLFQSMKTAGLALIFMDNPIPPGCWQADLLINALPHPPYPSYDPSRHPACLDGLEYFLLDETHERLRQQQRQIRPRVERVLVAMGGGDADNMTAKVIETLRLIDFDGEVDIVLGAANPHKKSLHSLFVSTGLRGSVNMSCPDLAERIMAADLGFSALGLTTYEMATLGLPAILLPQAGLNLKVAEIYCRDYNAARFVGSANAVSHEQIVQLYDLLRYPSVRSELSANGRYAVGPSKASVVDSIQLLFQEVLQ